MNKKLLRIAAAACLSGALCAGGFALSGCAWTTDMVSGEYHYANVWAPEAPHYGVKVNVEVQTDKKGDRIRKVTIADSDYVQLSAENEEAGWTDDNRQVYLDGEQELLNAYRGMYVADVLAMKASTSSTGEPSAVSDDSVVISGATQSSGRILLAVQDALCKFGGYSVSEGEYSYLNPWGPSSRYGVKVRVVTKGDVISKVVLLDTDYTVVSDGWADKDIWNNGIEGLLKAYEGKNKADILKVTVGMDANGQPSSVSDESFVISNPDDPNAAGATQGSGRLMLAVQNALDPDSAVGTKYSGTYSYTKGGSEYSVAVDIRVNGGVITKMDITSSSGDNIPDKDDASSCYFARGVANVLAVDVDCDENGAPTAIADSSYELSGEKEGSGAVLLAVQKAIESMNTFSVYEGSYDYPNAWAPTAPHYGIAVKVVTNTAGTIYAVAPANHSFVSVTDSWEDKNIWNNGLSGLLNSYVGKNMVDIIGEKVTCDANGQPTAVSNPDLMISGATQGSGRLLLAVQNAFASAGYAVQEGQYCYVNAWSPSTLYGIRVRVVTKNDIIEKVTIIDSDFIEVSDGWTDKDIWNNGIEALLAKYVGKSKSDILATTVTCDANGQPSAVSDSALMISGATQGSGRLLLAVQNAFGQSLGTSYEGEYHYTSAWGDYGIKVSVKVYGGVITDISIIDSDYVSVTDSWDKKDIWINGVDDLLANYIGRRVADILVQDVACKDNGEPTSVADSSLMISGATQGSGRLLLAVQDALGKVDGYNIYEGSYDHPNAWAPTAPHYGIKVRVVTDDSDKILAVGVIDSDYVEVSDSWDKKDIWNNGLKDLLNGYIGKSVAQVLAVDVVTNEKGQPEKVSDSAYFITGATQGSGRLLLAVQNALAGLGYQVVSGEYHYANQWAPEAPHYGIKVNVVVKDGKIAAVGIANSDYVSVTDSWENKDIWNSGISSLLGKYSGKTVEEILAGDVITDDNGQPNKVSDSAYFITGATQGSGRLMLAVQNALSKLN